MSSIFDIRPLPDSPLRYGWIAPTRSTEPVSVVYVPGLGGSVKNALDFLKPLADALGPVVSLDSRRFGINESVPPSPSPEKYLDDLDTLIQHLTETGQLLPDRPPILIGLSLGGVYASLYGIHHPHRFSAQILMAPAFAPHPKLFTTRFKIKNYSQVLLKGPWAKTTLPYGIHDLTRNPECYEDPHFFEPLRLPTFYLYLIDRLCQKATRSLPQITLPTAIIIPEQDRVCCPRAMQKAYEGLTISDKKLLTYHELFHDILMEPLADQQQLLKDILAWVEMLGASHKVPKGKITLS